MHCLPTLLTRFQMAKSSYYYQKAAMSRPDKYLSCPEKLQSFSMKTDRSMAIEGFIWR